MDTKTNGSTKAPEQEASSDGFSRRDFLRSSAAVGGAAAAVGAATEAFAADAPSLDIPSIIIPQEIPDTMNEDPKIGTFDDRGMTGAEVFA